MRHHYLSQTGLVLKSVVVVVVLVQMLSRLYIGVPLKSSVIFSLLFSFKLLAVRMMLMLFMHITGVPEALY